MLARSTRRCEPIKYYPINETAARRAKEMNSFSDYREGSATAEYRAMVDKAAAVAEHQKTRVDPMYHEKIDHLLDTYARKLAENMNQGFAIDARVPSVMIAGPANFPVRQKEKQNRARDGNMEEWRHIQGLLDKIRSTGMGGISADDPAAVEKLQKKLDSLERSQLIMKEVNAYYRKHGTLDGCALLSTDQIERLKSDMAASWRSSPKPFESYQLTNNNAEIRRVKARIEELSKRAEQTFSGWEFDGGHVEMNREDNRLQVFFDGKPDADTRAELKSSGFRWAPSVGAWQRQLTDNAIRAADRLECIRPLSGEKPSQLQKKPSILQTMREQSEKVKAEPPKEVPAKNAERKTSGHVGPGFSAPCTREGASRPAGALTERRLYAGRSQPENNGPFNPGLKTDGKSAGRRFLESRAGSKKPPSEGSDPERPPECEKADEPLRR